MLEKGIVLRIG